MSENTVDTHAGIPFSARDEKMIAITWIFHHVIRLLDKQTKKKIVMMITIISSPLKGLLSNRVLKKNQEKAVVVLVV